MALLNLQKMKKDRRVWIFLFLFLFRQDIWSAIDPMLAGESTGSWINLSPEVITFLVVIGVFFGPMIAIWVFNTRQSKKSPVSTWASSHWSRLNWSIWSKLDGWMLIDWSSQSSQWSYANSNHNVDMNTSWSSTPTNAFSLDGK